MIQMPWRRPGPASSSGPPQFIISRGMISKTRLPRGRNGFTKSFFEGSPQAVLISARDARTKIVSGTAESDSSPVVFRISEHHSEQHFALIGGETNAYIARRRIPVKITPLGRQPQPFDSQFQP